MKRWLDRASWTVALVASLGSIRTAHATENVNGNAALVYWQAFDGLPDVLTKDFNKAIATPVGEPMDKEVVELVERRSHVLLLLHRGASRSYCDWGIELAEDGPEAILPHLAPARNLARLALLRARHHFHEGRDAEGVKDVLAAMTLGRHAGRDRTLVGLLVDNAIQSISQDVAAAYLPRLSTSAKAQLASGLARLPSENPFAQCMVSEGVFAPWLVERVKATQSDAELLAACSRLVGDEIAKKFIESAGGKDGIIRHTKALGPLYDALPGLVNRPYDQDSTPFEILVRDAAQNPVGELLFPALDKAWHAHRRYQCRNALLRAAVDVAQHDKDVLSRHRDPTDGNQFEFVETDAGFELRSKLLASLDSGQVVHLVVGEMRRDPPKPTTRN